MMKIIQKCVIIITKLIILKHTNEFVQSYVLACKIRTNCIGMIKVNKKSSMHIHVTIFVHFFQKKSIAF